MIITKRPASHINPVSFAVFIQKLKGTKQETDKMITLE